MNHLITITVGSPAEAPGTTPSLLDKLEQEAGEKTQSAEGAAAQAKANLIVDPVLADIVPPAIEVPALELGQPVFHPAFGYGTVDAIEGDNVTFSSKRNPAATHMVTPQDLITKSQAEFGLQTCWFAGGAKAWRHATGRWASLTKNLCRYGEWADVLKIYDLNRSSMDDLICRFEEEITWEAQDAALAAANLPESGNLNLTTPEQSSQSSVYAVTGRPQVNERTPDPENERRQKNIRVEIAKRKGIKPTRHRTVLYLQRRHLEPERLARYYAFKDDNKKRVDAIMQRHVDEGMEEVLALAAGQPDVTPAPTAEESESATSAITEEVPANGAPQVNDAAPDVRSALLNLGFKPAEVKRVQVSPGLDFNEMMRQALKQLKPETAENEGE